jgi:hypothetical protein
MRLKLITARAGLMKTVQPKATACWVVVAVATALLPAGCVGTGGNAALNQGVQTVEVYHNLEVATDPRSAAVKEAIVDALDRHFTQVTAQRPALIGVPPETYGRLERAQLFAGSNLGAMAAMSGRGAELTTARCDGATLIARAVKSTDSQVLVANVCVFPFAEGQSVQIFGVHGERRTGGLASAIQSGVSQVVGSSESFWNAAMADLTASVSRAANGAVVYRDGTGGLPI